MRVGIVGAWLHAGLRRRLTVQSWDTSVSEGSLLAPGSRSMDESTDRPLIRSGDRPTLVLIPAVVPAQEMERLRRQTCDELRRRVAHPPLGGGERCCSLPVDVAGAARPATYADSPRAASHSS